MAKTLEVRQLDDEELGIFFNLLLEKYGEEELSETLGYDLKEIQNYDPVDTIEIEINSSEIKETYEKGVCIKCRDSVSNYPKELVTYDLSKDLGPFYICIKCQQGVDDGNDE